jgi:hypothetical protein
MNEDIYVQLNCLNVAKNLIVRLPREEAVKLTIMTYEVRRLQQCNSRVLHVTLEAFATDIAFVPTSFTGRKNYPVSVLDTLPLMTVMTRAKTGVRVYDCGAAWIVDDGDRIIETVIWDQDDIRRIAEGKL